MSIKIFENTDELLKEYSHVYLLGKGLNLSMLSSVAEFSGKNMLFLVPSDCYPEDDVKALNEYRMISAEETKNILDLYRTYEFSDKFHFLSSPSDQNYGSLMNYVRNGILTEEEGYAAMLKQ
ncbi:MAG: hypothetical protein K5871_07595 [Lachnospiraceae bacterium]|nr:hypothetical protein [Lachnospiraceae bacterium]